IVRMERDLHVDPVADDVATLTLDILVSEAGYQPHGVNLLLLTGGEEEPSDDDGPSSQSRSN
ncbi:MAG TPA: formate dehydrogenase accessory protein FdhE, partial [Massilia timonae]|nr:formate dehydrogenase accessory protein FdhE [Massilia timonae]